MSWLALALAWASGVVGPRCVRPQAWWASPVVAPAVVASAVVAPGVVAPGVEAPGVEAPGVEAPEEKCILEVRRVHESSQLSHKSNTCCPPSLAQGLLLPALRPLGWT